MQVLEYFENGESEEVVYSLEEMLPNLGNRRWLVPSIAMELAMDHKPSHRYQHMRHEGGGLNL